MKTRKTKIDVVKKWLSNDANLKWTLNELDLYLDNNHGPEVANLYSILKGETEGVLTKDDIKRLKWSIISDVLSIVKWYIGWYEDISISESTIKKAMKETDFYDKFNTMFFSSIKDSDNLKIFKKYF